MSFKTLKNDSIFLPLLLLLKVIEPAIILTLGFSPTLPLWKPWQTSVIIQTIIPFVALVSGSIGQDLRVKRQGRKDSKTMIYDEKLVNSATSKMNEIKILIRKLAAGCLDMCLTIIKLITHLSTSYPSPSFTFSAVNFSSHELNHLKPSVMAVQLSSLVSSLFTRDVTPSVKTDAASL